MVWVHLKWVGRQLQTTFYFRPSQYTLLLYLFLTFFISHPFCFRCKESQNWKGSHKDFLQGGGIRRTQGQDPQPPQHSEGPQDQRHLQVSLYLLQQGKESAVCTLGHLQSLLQLTSHTDHNSQRLQIKILENFLKNILLQWNRILSGNVLVYFIE